MTGPQPPVVLDPWRPPPKLSLAFGLCGIDRDAGHPSTHASQFATRFPSRADVSQDPEKMGQDERKRIPHDAKTIHIGPILSRHEEISALVRGGMLAAPFLAADAWGQSDAARRGALYVTDNAPLEVADVPENGGARTRQFEVLQRGEPARLRDVDEGDRTRVLSSLDVYRFRQTRSPRISK